MALVVGLGNPGPRYRGTRHNAGFLVLDELFRRWDVDPSADKVAIRGRAGEHRLVKPLTFMNLSGRAVQAEMTRYGIPPDDLIVVHDDLDLPLGRLRLKVGGGAGGQKGVRDITERIGPDFVRVKVGIGRPPERWTVENWVLSRFRPEELALVDEVATVAADAVERILAEGIEAAMNAFNGVDLRAAEPADDEPDEALDQPNRPEM